MRDLDGPLVAGVGVAHDAGAGVVGQDPSQLLPGEGRAIGDGHDASVDRTADPEALRAYTSGEQVVRPYDFTTSIVTALHHCAPDVVVAQDPPPATETAEVRLLVNRGEDRATYVMPDLIGVNGDSATAMLRNHGFRVAVVASAPYPGVPAGVVLRQNPQAGFQIVVFFIVDKDYSSLKFSEEIQRQVAPAMAEKWR